MYALMRNNSRRCLAAISVIRADQGPPAEICVKRLTTTARVAIFAMVYALSMTSIADATTVVRQVRLAHTDCSNMQQLEQLAGSASIRSPECVVRIRTVMRPQAQSLRRMSMNKRARAAGVSCNGYWRSYSYGWWLSVNVNVGLCTNGSVVWKDWGPDCGVNFNPVYWPIYGSKVDWCGVYDEWHHEAQPGINFGITPLHIPWTEIGHGWARFSAWPWGVNWGVGGCC